MEWFLKMNEVMDYIENNLEKEIELSKAAKIVCLSGYHFQRMFHITTGFSFGEYIRKRRLTLAANDIITSKEKVIDIAYKYSYESPEAFSRAFKSLHGVSPSGIRSNGGNLKTFPRLSFQIILKGEKNMDYRIVKKKAFKVQGEVRRFTNKNEENKIKIPLFWKECFENGFSEKLEKIIDKDTVTGESKLGICMNFEEKTQEFDYMIAVEKTKDNGDNKLTEREIPASTWAIFECVGAMPDAIQEVWKKIYKEWFPSTGYEHSGTADLEVYFPGNGMDENYKCEIWLPVKKK
ncbi:MAG: AraC family transcriptional regulator [Clostridiales bacterium]